MGVCVENVRLCVCRMDSLNVFLCRFGQPSIPIGSMATLCYQLSVIYMHAACELVYGIEQCLNIEIH